MQVLAHQEGETALVKAASRDSFATVAYQVEHEADVNYKGEVFAALFPPAIPLNGT